MDRRRRAMAADVFKSGGSNTLLDGLVAYWKFAETVVTGAEPAVDTVASLSLVHTNNPLGTTGIIGNARAFVAASSQVLATAANPAALNFTGDFSLSCWINFTTNTNQDVLQKYSNADRGFALLINTQRFRFRVGRADTPGASVDVTDANFGTVSAGVWYHVYCWCTSGSVIGVRINDTAQTTASFSGFTPNPAVARLFSIGNQPISGFLNGAIDELGFWGRLLTAGEVTALYNGGAGRTHPF